MATFRDEIKNLNLNDEQTEKMGLLVIAAYAAGAACVCKAVDPNDNILNGIDDFVAVASMSVFDLNAFGNAKPFPSNPQKFAKAFKFK